MDSYRHETGLASDISIKLNALTKDNHAKCELCMHYVFLLM